MKETEGSHKSVVSSRNSPTGTEHILLVDDEGPILQMEQIILEKLGYQVTARASSPDALGAFRANPAGFDLVLSDMGIPNMTGEQLARELISIKQIFPLLFAPVSAMKMTKIVQEI